MLTNDFLTQLEKKVNMALEANPEIKKKMIEGICYHIEGDGDIKPIQFIEYGKCILPEDENEIEYALAEGDEDALEKMFEKLYHFGCKRDTIYDFCENIIEALEDDEEYEDICSIDIFIVESMLDDLFGDEE